MKTVCNRGVGIYCFLARQILASAWLHCQSFCSRCRFNDENKTQHLLTFDGAKERLQLINEDLLEEGSFDVVIDGCDGVFHTASLFLLSTSDPQAELIDPALMGTLNVLRSCVKTPLVKRVVLTSSLAAIIINGKPRTPQVVVDENWWSDSKFCRKIQQWYFLSKTLAEDAAWKFVKEKEMDHDAKEAAKKSCELYVDMMYSFPHAFTKFYTDTEDGSSMSDGLIRTKFSDVAKHRQDIGRTNGTLLDLYSGCGAMSSGLCIGASLDGVTVTTWARLPQFPLPTHKTLKKGVVINEFKECIVGHQNENAELLEPVLLGEVISDLPSKVTNDSTMDQMPYDSTIN
ncbi:hypothetical protein CASFOL_034463 [Castilleja foliolosa]|uniref:3-beta hydroxysteroid dehydrogenase/isomerase domain-containing protein n=1 Tax=Castilleja foliolosa TaxID=1961234 RepID=A0ABD3BVZ8_9LAMI